MEVMPKLRFIPKERAEMDVNAEKEVNVEMVNAEMEIHTEREVNATM